MVVWAYVCVRSPDEPQNLFLKNVLWAQFVEIFYKLAAIPYFFMLLTP